MKWRVHIFWIVCVVVVLIRCIFVFTDSHNTAHKCIRKSVTGSGRIVEDPSRTDTGQVFTMRADRIVYGDIVCSEDVHIRVRTHLYPRFSHGDYVIFSGNLSEPFNFRGSNGRVFNYKGYLAKDHIYYEIKGARIEMHGGNVDFQSSNDVWGSIVSLLVRFKRSFVGNLEQVLGEPHAALAAGLVVGEKSSLGKELLDDFRLTGLIHIVVLSGFNITIIAVAFRRILMWLPRTWGIVASLLGIILFGVLVGGGATVVRSCCMAGVTLFAEFIRRDYHALRALIFVGLIMIAQNPLIVFYDPSFQLSFLATCGLIVLSKPIEDRISWVPDTVGLRGIVASTLATYVFVSPLLLYMMGQISLVGIVANILVVPVVPLTMLLVVVSGAGGFVSHIASSISGWGAHILLSYELMIVEYFSQIPFAAISISSFSVWWVVGVYGVFLVFIMRRSLVPSGPRLRSS